MSLDCIPQMGLTVSPVTPMSSYASFSPAPGRAQGAGYRLRDLEPQHWRSLGLKLKCPGARLGMEMSEADWVGTMRIWRATVSPS